LALPLAVSAVFLTLSSALIALPLLTLVSCMSRPTQES
jgi:hypothetical protein